MFLQNISKFISNYRYEQASKETLNVVKAAFIDFFGVTYRGVNEESSRIAFNTISELFLEIWSLSWNLLLLVCPILKQIC